MKKIKVYLPLFFIFVVTVTGLSFDVIIPNVYSMTLSSYNQQVADQKNNLWQLGKNLSTGDSYTYKICDPSAVLNYSAESYHYFTKNLEHNSSLCYVVKLDFVNLLHSNENQINSDIWVVQASISNVLGDNEPIRRSVFHIDSDSFEVRSADTIHPDTIRYTQSLEDTIFSIFKYTASEPKLLQKNVTWGEVTEYRDHNQNNPDMKVLEDNLEFNIVENAIVFSQNKIIQKDKTFDVYQVGYEIDIIDNNDPAQQQEDTNNVTNSYLISPQIPFPVSGILYSPAHITEPFKESEFELISFVFDDEMTEEVIEQDGSIEEDDTIPPDEIIVEENIVDETIEETIEEAIVEETIMEVIPVEPVVIEMTEEESIGETIDSEYSLDKSIILVILLVAVISVILVYHKKFRNSNKYLKKSFVKNNKSLFNKTVHFDDKITIKIKNRS